MKLHSSCTVSITCKPSVGGGAELFQRTRSHDDRWCVTDTVGTTPHQTLLFAAVDSSGCSGC